MPSRPFLPPAPEPPNLPRLSVGEYGRLVACGRLPHPVSWGNTLEEQIRYVDYALEARDPALAPDTLAERARQAQSNAAEQVASGGRWPHCGVEPGMEVWVDGLRMRPELNGSRAVVVGLCHKTRRVGIKVEGGDNIYVLVERLAPCADDEGDGGIAYDHRFLLDLQAKVLAFITTAACDELGVSFDSIVAAMATVAATASIDDIRVVVDKLVYEGDCYTTVDDQHVLAV